MPGTRKLGRETSHRLAMLRGLVTFLLENGRIETTYTRAKEVSALAEKCITRAKVENLQNKRQALAFITKEDVVNKLFMEIRHLAKEQMTWFRKRSDIHWLDMSADPVEEASRLIADFCD